MSSGVEIVTSTEDGSGVLINLPMFSGVEMMQRGEQFGSKNSPPFPKSVQPNVDGYIYGMCDEGTSRMVRHVNHRKRQVRSRSRNSKVESDNGEDLNNNDDDETDDDGKDLNNNYGDETDDDGEVLNNNKGGEMDDDGEDLTSPFTD
ncbi:hypothetical protein DAPPUDRAFT_106735 [Daphnia pulex]|uniref:Uncharacterized protein n=1 Tax=Daphnia pulex TaxID=6669 RepID=E9GUF3_DAPPU|nr:hypothetical protein DAPPUDRAFT_106735 [Daphnia pulex]|eukprot:EFX76857.1 hypothetical protein DAPPUDRAFT_106735 [Daphnia pulex]